MTNTDTGPRLRMPERVADALTCPVCGQALSRDARGLLCPARHSFNVAREGYAGLLTGATPPGTGDSKEMVADRLRFQTAGHYDPIARALADALTGGARDPLIVDVGGGTGHYLARILDALPDAVGLTTDVSKFAARKAAKAHPRAGAVTADSWRILPLVTGGVDALVNVFAPRNAAEFHRVLAPTGRLVVVTPASDHLAELRPALGLLDVDPRKDERLAESLHTRFAPAGERSVRFAMDLSHPDALTVVGMGPSARHVTPQDLAARVASLPDPVRVTASVRVGTYRPEPARRS
ncbi:putative RNA methyltransferase [Nocardiopsis sp. MG754419]|uniref:putative RNA methyltransferase n=1 Tax=Nocardiopsis sp. MG754419 TaxID=2259865 RepID=UPI001BABAD34|nr:methyltransferase type 11 [Nocardiopsis sp. MG754419]MBR8744080.1 methyltransferase type 11 [Nocardiopsis sp. MG754419]